MAAVWRGLSQLTRDVDRLRELLLTLDRKALFRLLEKLLQRLDAPPEEAPAPNVKPPT